MGYELSEEEYPYLTKTGGYKEIPEEVILEEAERIGLEESKIPPFGVTRRKRVWFTPEKILIPRRERKTSVRDTIVHELAHIKLEHGGYDSPQECVEHEIEVYKLIYGKVKPLDLANFVLRLKEEFGLTTSESVRIVMDVARNLGVGSRTRTYGRKLAGRFLGE